jgi:integrase
MAVTKLTKKAVDATTSTGKDYCLWDDEVKGFGLRVTAKGAKSYLVQYRFGGRAAKVKRVYIGQHGSPWTPDSARKQAMIILGDIAKGVDVAIERQRSKAEHAASQTFTEFSERFVAHHLNIKCKPETQKECKRLLQKVILPRFGKRLVKDITRADVSRLHHELAATPYQANRVVMLLSKMFNLAEVWGERPEYSNPCRLVAKYKEKMRGRMLTPDELSRLMAVLDSYGADCVQPMPIASNVIPLWGATLNSVEASRALSPFAVAAIRLLIFTGARKGEVVNMRWEWIDLEQGEVHLPDSKTGAKTIYLSPQAVEVLRNIPRIVGCPYVIAGLNPSKPISGLQNIWERIRKQAGLEDVRLHDLRHNYASVAVCAGMSLPIVGKMLGHTQAQTTMRYAHLAAEPVKLAAAMVGDKLAAAHGEVRLG